MGKEAIELDKSEWGRRSRGGGVLQRDIKQIHGMGLCVCVGVALES
jgi:hypothetical protein